MGTSPPGRSPVPRQIRHQPPAGAKPTVEEVSLKITIDQQGARALSIWKKIYVTLY